MKKFKKGKEVVYTFENYLSKKQCKKYASTIKELGAGVFQWPQKTQDITKKPVVQKLQNFLNKTFNLNLKIVQAQSQNWNQTSWSGLHIHDRKGRENTTYNSSIYLNDDFGGGRFFTKNGIKIKPTTGLLTFFNGRKVWHGVEKVKDKDRKTLIFWWTEK